MTSEDEDDATVAGVDLEQVEGEGHRVELAVVVETADDDEIAALWQGRSVGQGQGASLLRVVEEGPLAARPDGLTLMDSRGDQPVYGRALRSGESGIARDDQDAGDAAGRDQQRHNEAKARWPKPGRVQHHQQSGGRHAGE